MTIYEQVAYTFIFQICKDSTIWGHDGFFFVGHPKWAFCFLCLSMLTTWLLLGITISTPSATTIFLPYQIAQCISLCILLLEYRSRSNPLHSRAHLAYPKCVYEQSTVPQCSLPTKEYVDLGAQAHVQATKLASKWWYALGLPLGLNV